MGFSPFQEFRGSEALHHMVQGEGTQFASAKPSRTREEQVSSTRLQISETQFVLYTWHLTPDT